MRIGIGYDVHKLDYNRDLILGGVKIPHEKGLVAHSDGDCLIHAIIDSILGACGLYDIGTYFPDTSDNFKDISSLKLLEKTRELMENEKYEISNIDSIIICQKPKINPYINIMRETLCNVLRIDISQITIKATTEEKLGFTGKEKGIACQAVCLLHKIKKGQ
ncbi:2-C-methyl-D-erythritol 2,4-cyclodiphosphate synthase [Candidatus Arthromitus sp. SFB-mouse-Japan]|uniref:2-C-methyl-D-erythritol 2,4-cyclodiphosphate synthase n=1 Tax=Candidatus Arthromitus sp. SFB-mouse TaxID=49118 RepID=UPI00021B80DD|nr:2-C-methyl-D-erythritol 2,4-cyclodiphosphate synthase [Candidatus Arthromitus sp. SFB-mouse]BAK55937.1 2-C-methyl-D-erythritol 2,4-cyclodiphosphate synthase [Candidatus Arthromitus sp. SFB-mouse-Japan]